MGLVGVNRIVVTFFCFFMFLDIKQGTQFFQYSKLLKTEMIFAKCSKTMKVYKSEDTVDKWC